MSNQNEVIQEQKYEEYGAYLETLDMELLCYEFTDRMGAEPEGYFSKGNIIQDNIIWKLLDSYSLALYEDPSINWVPKPRTLKEEIAEINRHIKRIKGIREEIERGE